VHLETTTYNLWQRVVYTCTIQMHATNLWMGNALQIAPSYTCLVINYKGNWVNSSRTRKTVQPKRNSWLFKRKTDSSASIWQRVRTRRVVSTRTRTRTRKILPVGLPVPACG
jgi:hypothetical protein